MSERFRIAILSDIHAGEGAHGDTHVTTEPPASRPNHNPLRDLHEYASSGELKADLLLCPGDLANRAHSLGQIYGWNTLQQVAAAFEAQTVVATVGNHDVVTRTPTPDQAQLLKSLTPQFPVNEPTLATAYWSDGYYIDDSDPRFRILNINTCADFPDHPGQSANDVQKSAHQLTVERGAISEDRLLKIGNALRSLSEKHINIVLMHHHPVEHARQDLLRDTYGPAENGEKLLDVLETASNCGRWMLIHGHKHIPNFTTDGGSANSPLVLCAASVGGHLWQPVAAVTRNQFHIVEFEIQRILGLPLTRGTVRSWAWSFGRGWSEAAPTTGLPAKFGFGALSDPRDLADQVTARLNDDEEEIKRWSEITAIHPLLTYIGPKDFELFEDRLDLSGFVLERNRFYEITAIARKAIWP